MAGPRHPVSVRAVALVETERLQVRPYVSLPTSRRKEGRELVHGLDPPRCSQPFLQQTFAFSVRWSDNSNTFVRRTWDEFRRLHVSEPGGTRFPPIA